MKRTIVCPTCKEKLDLPIDKCPKCGFVFQFQKLQPVVPVDAVVPLDYDPKKNLEETSIIPTVVIYDDKEILKPEPVKPKERKRIKQKIDYAQIDHEKRLSFAFIFTMVMCFLTTLVTSLPLFTLIYELIYNLNIEYAIYDILDVSNGFLTILLVAYYILIGIFSINKNRKLRLTGFTLTLVSTIMHLGFMLALQFIILSAGVVNYIILITLILWCATQAVLLDIKREG